VHLVRNSNLEELERYLNLNGQAASCANRPAPDLTHLSDCVTCRITATFTGGIDGFPNQRVNGISREKLEKKRMGRVLDTWACSMPKLLLPPLKKWLQWTNPNFVSQLQFRTDEMGV
jgi:hypothetical protein